MVLLTNKSTMSQAKFPEEESECHVENAAPEVKVLSTAYTGEKSELSEDDAKVGRLSAKPQNLHL